MELDSDAILWSHPAEEREGRPLLVLLHGYGSHEADLFSLRSELPPELVLASLRAPLPMPPGFAWFPIGSERPLVPTALADESAELIADWLRRETAGASSTGLLGFSQGAMLSLLLLRRDPSLADYAILLSGGLFAGDADGDTEGDALLAERRPPVFFGYGTADQVIPPGLLERTAEWLPERTEVTARAYPGMGHSVSLEELADIQAFLRERLGA